jgi:hypothetical protein
VVVVGGKHKSKTGELKSPSPVSGLDPNAAQEHLQAQGRDLSPGRFLS